MAILDYNTEAELSATASEELSRIRRRRMRQPAGYGRFARAADAIRFAIEELPAELLPAAQLKVAEETFDCDAIRRLYESVEYPLVRRAAGRSAVTGRDIPAPHSTTLSAVSQKGFRLRMHRR
jgi:Arc/MetJ-type ribon-helix-helix transcriptional regulator